MKFAKTNASKFIGISWPLFVYVYIVYVGEKGRRPGERAGPSPQTEQNSQHRRTNKQMNSDNSSGDTIRQRRHDTTRGGDTERLIFL